METSNVRIDRARVVLLALLTWILCLSCNGASTQHVSAACVSEDDDGDASDDDGGVCSPEEEDAQIAASQAARPR